MLTYEDYLEIKEGVLTKAQAARDYGVSPRTIGRWYQTMEAECQALALESEAVESKDFEEFVWCDPDDSTVDQQPEVEYQVVGTKRSISISKLIDGRLENTASIDNTNPIFDEALQRIKESGMSQEVLAEVYLLMQPATMVESFSQGKIRVDMKTKQIFFGDYEVDGLLTKRIIETVGSQGIEGANALINFMERLMENPSNRAVRELYGFLEASDIQITQDGHFIAWKLVRDDYKDIYTGTMDNSPGTEVRVPRNTVDEDSSRTCSTGLHCCSAGYLSQYGPNDSRIVSVLVDPKDVVAIPQDYSSQKMRCAGYIVLEDVTDKMSHYKRTSFSY